MDPDQHPHKKRIQIRIRIRVIRRIRILSEVWWIYNTVPNRAGFESGYGSEAGNGFFFFMQMLFWIMILRNRFFFFDFSLLNIFGTQSSEPLKKKSNLLHVWVAVCMCSHFFSLRGIVLQKCGRDINCSLDYSSS